MNNNTATTAAPQKPGLLRRLLDRLDRALKKKADEKSSQGSNVTVGSVFTGVAWRRPLAFMWLSTRQTYSQVRSHFSVQEALV